MSIQGHQWLKSSTFITSLLLIVCYAHLNSIGYAMLKMYSKIFKWMHMGISLTYIILMLFKIPAGKTDGWTYQEIYKVENKHWRLPLLQSFHTVVVVSIFCTLHGSSLYNSLQIKVLFYLQIQSKYSLQVKNLIAFKFGFRGVARFSKYEVRKQTIRSKWYGWYGMVFGKKPTLLG